MEGIPIPKGNDRHYNAHYCIFTQVTDEWLPQGSNLHGSQEGTFSFTKPRGVQGTIRCWLQGWRVRSRYTAPLETRAFYARMG